MVDVLLIFAPQRSPLVDALSQSLNAVGMSTKQILFSGRESQSELDLLEVQLSDARMAVFVYSPTLSPQEFDELLDKLIPYCASTYLIMVEAQDSWQFPGPTTIKLLPNTRESNGTSQFDTDGIDSPKRIIQRCLQYLKKLPPITTLSSAWQLPEPTQALLHQILDTGEPPFESPLWVDQVELITQGNRQQALLMWTTDGLTFISSEEITSIQGQSASSKLLGALQVLITNASFIHPASALSLPYSAIYKIEIEPEHAEPYSAMTITLSESNLDRNQAREFANLLEQISSFAFPIETVTLLEHEHEGVLLKLKLFVSNDGLSTTQKMVTLFNVAFEPQISGGSLILIEEASTRIQSNIVAQRFLPDAKMQRKLFLSYSRQDFAFVTDLKKLLVNHHFTVWLDVEKIRSGQLWWSAIEEGITAADYFVMVISPWSVTSAVVLTELKTARLLNKPIIGILLENVPEAVIPLDLCHLKLAFIDPWQGDLRATAKTLAHLIDQGNLTEQSNLKTLAEASLLQKQKSLPLHIIHQLRRLGIAVLLSFGSATLFLAWLISSQLQRLPQNIGDTPVFFWIQFPIITVALTVLPLGYLKLNTQVRKRRVRTVILLGFTVLTLFPAAASIVYLFVDILQFFGVQARTNTAAILDGQSGIPLITAVFSGLSFFIAFFNAGMLSIWLITDPERSLRTEPVTPWEASASPAFGFTEGVVVHKVNLVFTLADQEAALQIARRLSQLGIAVGLNDSSDTSQHIGLVILFSGGLIDDGKFIGLAGTISHAISRGNPILPILVDKSDISEVAPDLQGLNYLRLHSLEGVESIIEGIHALLRGEIPENEDMNAAPGTGLFYLYPIEILLFIGISTGVILYKIYEFLQLNATNASVLLLPEMAQAAVSIQWFNYLVAIGLYAIGIFFQIILTIATGRQAIRFFHIIVIQSVILALDILLERIQYLTTVSQGQITYLPGFQIQTFAPLMDLALLILALYALNNHWWLPVKTKFQALGWDWGVIAILVIMVLTCMFYLY